MFELGLHDLYKNRSLRNDTVNYGTLEGALSFYTKPCQG